VCVLRLFADRRALLVDRRVTAAVRHLRPQ